ncbi:hypothetical protein B0H13DRAFT_2537801 [Mycena leptocephala]|nr:hypothetical protein B0H13DRAFT_2537801 [Mycena leptocephala]
MHPGLPPFARFREHSRSPEIVAETNTYILTTWPFKSQAEWDQFVHWDVTSVITKCVPDGDWFQTLPSFNEAIPCPRLVQSKDVLDDGIVFKVIIDADGKILEGPDDPDNATHLDLVKRNFEAALAGGLRLKNARGTIRGGQALNSFAINTIERNLFHGTAAENIELILKNGFLIPGVSPGVAMVHGSTCGSLLCLKTLNPYPPVDTKTYGFLQSMGFDKDPGRSGREYLQTFH